MIIPIGTDNPLSRRPLVNYALVAGNIIIFVLTSTDVLNSESRVMTHYALQRFPLLHQFITYAFLHANWGHVLGNMLFLYVFGNSVNDRLGHIGYGLLYLGGAIFSGIGHLLTSDASVIGASGAVATVTGAYMVLFPKTRVFLLFWLFFFIDTISISALYFILFQIVWGNILGPLIGAGQSNVAFTAHLAGYLYGITLPLAMLMLKLLPHSHFDLWALLKRWQRRQDLAGMTRKGFNPFLGKTPGKKSVHVDVKVTDSTPNEQTEKVANLRAEIAKSLGNSDFQTAADSYIHLIDLDPNQVLPQQQQLDVANKLMHTGKHQPAAQAYEAFIQQYPRYPFIEQVQLMLGLLYSRYLRNPDLARKHLKAAQEKLTDPGQKQMCQTELDRL